MVVVTITNCSPKLRGDLSKWLLEINTGVYVGKVSAKVRDALWKRICENISDGQATMVFSAQNEQHMDFYVHNTSWKPVDLDGIKLMKHMNPTAVNSGSELKPGYSYASIMRKAQRKKKRIAPKDYIILDIETTGISYENDEITEIGYIKVENGKMTEEKGALIKTEKNIPENITKLTGISDQMLLESGVELKGVLEELFAVINGQNVVIYNADFDLNFLEKGAKKYDLEFPSVTIADVFEIARKRLRGLENYTLETVAKAFGITEKQRHRAIEDCQILFEVYCKLNEI